MQNLFNRIIKISIYLLVFLLPLFFLPFSFEAFEFNKQYLLFFLVSITLLTWLAKMVLVDKEIKFKRTPLDLPVLLFLFIAILSAVFSVDKSSSLFGFYGRFSDGLIGLLSLGVLYFLITNNVQSRITAEELPTTEKKPVKISPKSATISGMLKTFLWSSFFVILISYFSIFGVWSKIGSLPWVIQQTTFNPISGSLEGLTVFLTVVVILLIGLLLFQQTDPGSRAELATGRSPKKGQKRSLFSLYFLLVASLVLLVAIDFRAAWIIMLIPLILLVGFSLWKRILRENVNRLLLPILLIAIAAIFIFSSPIRTTFTNFANLPQEIILDQGSSWGIGLKAAIENVKSGFFGSGIGTWHYDFSKFKSVEFNQNLFWQIRFDRAGSHLAEILGTMGFLGLLSYLVLIGMFLLMSWFFLQTIVAKSSASPAARPTLDSPEGPLPSPRRGGAYQLGKPLPLLMVFLALVVSQFVYYQNTVLAFIFWLVLGLSVVSWQKPVVEKTLSFKDFPELSLVFSALLIILGLAFLGMYFFAGKFYLADVNYKNAVGEARIENLEKAVRLNPDQSQYKTILARAYLGEVLTELQKPVDQQNQVAISNNVQLAITCAKGGQIGRVYLEGATELGPNRVATWETLGMIYREIRGLATGALEWGTKSFERAIELEPANPVLHTELGKLYLTAGDIEKAKEKFAKAKELKSDYVDALIQEALIYEQENNLPEAIKKMEEVASNFPFNINTLFQLGRLYFNNNQIDQAISQFERITTLMPNHSNALYSLGIAYQRKGRISEAITAFKRVLELNPENQDVIRRLEELRKE